MVSEKMTMFPCRKMGVGCFLEQIAPQFIEITKIEVVTKETTKLTHHQTFWTPSTILESIIICGVIRYN